MNRKNLGERKKSLDLTSFLNISIAIKNDSSFQSLKSLFTELKRKYNIPSAELVKYIDEREILLPDCIFTAKLSIFQSIVKYLKENIGLKNNKIASLTHKSQKSIWQAYNYTKKIPSKFRIIPAAQYIPISNLLPQLTTLESIVIYLKEKSFLNFHQIALALKRDDRTIWTVYQRAKKKRPESERK